MPYRREGDDSYRNKNNGKSKRNIGNTRLDHKLGGSTASVFVGQGTNGPGDVRIGPILTANTKGLISFAKLVANEPSTKSANFSTLHWRGGNGADVNVSLESVLDISKRFANSFYGFFLGTQLLIRLMKIMSKTLGGRSSFARAMIDLQADEELKDTIVMVVPLQ
nr:hypothetical protein [Tanacetum cinerariifolium]